MAMIIVIDALNAEKFSGVLDEVYKLRARVFEGRLGWDVNVKEGREIDQFDGFNPAHVVSIDDHGDVVGCMRLLQTTGPHMLSDVFYELLDGDAPLRSAQIWEATRFCVDTQKLSGGKTRGSISYVTSEVMVGAFEYAQAAGVLDAVAVIDPVMNRILKRSANAPYDYLGSTKPMGVVNAMAALMDCSDERIQNIRSFAGIDHNVFLSEADALSLFVTKTKKVKALQKINPIELKNYCLEQLQSASNEEELQAAMNLLNTLSDKIGTNDPTELQRMSFANASDSTVLSTQEF